MISRVEIHRPGFLNKDHLVEVPNLRVDQFDTRFSSCLRHAAAREIVKLLSASNIADEVTVDTVESECLYGNRDPFIRILDNNLGRADHIAGILKNYLNVRIEIVPLARHD